MSEWIMDGIKYWLVSTRRYRIRTVSPDRNKEANGWIEIIVGGAFFREIDYR